MLSNWVIEATSVDFFERIAHVPSIGQTALDTGLLVYVFVFQRNSHKTFLSSLSTSPRFPPSVTSFRRGSLRIR